jgi:hypothetical protein
VADLAVLDQPPEELLQRAVVLGDRGGGDPVGECREEGLEVLPGDAGGPVGIPASRSQTNRLSPTFR